MEKDSLLLHFCAGAVAACGAVTFTNPWEVVKTRLQLQGELVAKLNQRTYPNALTAFYKIIRYEGLRGIQKGLMPAYAYQILLNGTRLGFYDPMRNHLTNIFPTPLSAMVASSMICGVAGAFIASPLFLVKTRMQSYSTVANAVGHQHEYVSKGAMHSLKRIYQLEGLNGLWRGVDAAMVRTGIGSAVQLPFYEIFKCSLVDRQVFNHDSGMPLHFSASLMTSFLLCLAMNPFDLASTRMYNQKSSGNKGSLYKNGLDCIIQTIRIEGWKALYKGFTAHYLRIGPHTILSLVFLEQTKRLLT